MVTVQGPFLDLDDLDEKQQRKQLVMSLSLLDLRDNKLTSPFQKDAVAFLRETVVLLFDNPFNAESLKSLSQEFNDPSHLFRATTEFDDDFRLIMNPLHIYKPM